MWKVRPAKANGLMSDDLVTIAISPFIPDKLFLGTSGYGFCLDQSSGDVVR